MRAPKPQEKRRGARLILKAAGLLRLRLSSSVAAAAAGAAAVGGEEREGAAEDKDERWWQRLQALNARLYEPSVVAAARRLFPSIIGRAMRQHPETVVAGFKYEPNALLDSFLLALHPGRFDGTASSPSTSSPEEEMMRLRRMKMSAEERAGRKALMDAGAALAETFEALLREFLHLVVVPSSTSSTTTTRLLQARMRLMMLKEGEPISSSITATTAARLLLPQLRAYQGAFAAWAAVAPPPDVLSAQLSSTLEGLLGTRERLVLAVADDEEAEAERGRRLVRLDSLIQSVRDSLQQMRLRANDAH
jgi:hypothetical protein